MEQPHKPVYGEGVPILTHLHGRRFLDADSGGLLFLVGNIELSVGRGCYIFKKECYENS